jgi:CBS domain-containing protein
MDGGRVVRALLSMWKGHALATRIAARLGQVLAIMFGLVGLATGNLILALVGAFIFFAASAEGRAAAMIRAARGMRNSDAMIDRFARLGRDSRLVDAVDCRLRTGQQVVPVCDADGRLVGMLTRQGMFDQLKKSGSETPVVESTMTELPRVHMNDALEASVRSLLQGSAAAVGVVDDDERLVGLVTRETIDDLLMLDRLGRGRPQGRRSVIGSDIKA